MDFTIDTSGHSEAMALGVGTPNVFDRAGELSKKGLKHLQDGYDSVRKGYTEIAEHQRQLDASIKQARQDTISQYKTFYYSGGQAQIYMEDVFLDEVVGLSFSTVTNKSPIYAYSSVYFDTVARGNLIISGTLEINFVHSHYLAIIARDLVDKHERGKAFLDRSSPFYPLLGTSVLPGAREAKQFQLQQSLNRLRGLGNQDFMRLVDQIEQEKLARGVSQEGLFEDFYDIPSFNIWATFGDIHNKSANSTVRKIVDVHLTGQTQTVYSSGEPIKEQYSFIARDIV